MNKFLDLFNVKKPVIGMLHLGGEAVGKDPLAIAKKEMDIYLENGINGVIVEDYFGDVEDVESMLSYLDVNRKDVVYGVNVLHSYKQTFLFAEEYNAKFIQIDSVSGHLKTIQDMYYGEQLAHLRENIDVPVIGGVRFKYQPQISGRTLKDDLKIGMKRSDAIVVTGSATGVETEESKIKEFKDIIGDYPLVIGAGLTPENCDSLLIADAAIVGSYVKDRHRAEGRVSADNVKRLMEAVKDVRARAEHQEKNQKEDDFER